MDSPFRYQCRTALRRCYSIPSLNTIHQQTCVEIYPREGKTCKTPSPCLSSWRSMVIITQNILKTSHVVTGKVAFLKVRRVQWGADMVKQGLKIWSWDLRKDSVEVQGLKDTQDGSFHQAVGSMWAIAHLSQDKLLEEILLRTGDTSPHSPTSFWCTMLRTLENLRKHGSDPMFLPQAQESLSYPSNSQMVIPQNDNLSWVGLMSSASKAWSFSNCWEKILMNKLSFHSEFFFSTF